MSGNPILSQFEGYRQMLPWQMNSTFIFSRISFLFSVFLSISKGFQMHPSNLFLVYHSIFFLIVATKISKMGALQNR